MHVVLHTTVISIIVWKWSIHYVSLSALLNLLHSSCNQGSHYENMDHAKEAITCNLQIDTFLSQQRWMEHKTGYWLVHEQCIVRTAVCQQAPLGLEQGKIKSTQGTQYSISQLINTLIYFCANSIVIKCSLLTSSSG